MTRRMMSLLTCAFGCAVLLQGGCGLGACEVGQGGLRVDLRLDGTIDFGQPNDAAVLAMVSENREANSAEVCAAACRPQEDINLGEWVHCKTTTPLTLTGCAKRKDYRSVSRGIMDNYYTIQEIRVVCYLAGKEIAR